MKEIYVFGHRNPDTDSVCSAIALSHLKNKMGLNTVPKILSDINKESKFVLDYFGMKKPEFLNDVKIKIKDIKYAKNVMIYEKESVNVAFRFMAEYHLTGLPVVDADKNLIGYLSLKEVATFLASSENQMLHTSLSNIINTFDAQIITNYSEEIIGHVIVAGLDDDTFFNEVSLKNDSILIVGNRIEIVKRAIDSQVKLIIVSCDKDLDKETIKLANDNEVSILKIKDTSFKVANKIYQTNIINTIISDNIPLSICAEDFLSDFEDMLKKSGHSNYPVLNKRGKCIGLIKSSKINEYKKQEVILVDHNTFAQSAIGIEEANILEVIDHHNLGSISTTLPICFRSAPVGCTSTILSQMYDENNVEIPREIAGLMLSAILSDTLLFTSPTTTDDDRYAAKKLAAIADVDIEKYGQELLKAASSLDGMSIKDMVFTDYKAYTVQDKEIGLSVITTTDFDSMMPRIDEIVELLDQKVEEGYLLHVMFVTDVIKNGSYIIYNSNSKDLIEEAFSISNAKQGIFVKELVSRKKQMLPRILEFIE